MGNAAGWRSLPCHKTYNTDVLSRLELWQRLQECYTCCISLACPVPLCSVYGPRGTGLHGLRGGCYANCSP